MSYFRKFGERDVSRAVEIIEVEDITKVRFRRYALPEFGATEIHVRQASRDCQTLGQGDAEHEKSPGAQGLGDEGPLDA